jgi:WD40 repeat protein
MKATLSALMSFLRRGWSRKPDSPRGNRPAREAGGNDFNSSPVGYNPKREMLRYALEALQAETHHLTRWPELTFPQLYNELYYKRSNSADVRKWCESGATEFGRTWLRRTAPDGTRSPNLRATFAGHEDVVHGCRFSPDSRYLASVCLSGTLRVLDVLSGRELACLRSDGASLRDCCWSPDGQRIATVGDSPFLRVWDWKNQEILAAIQIADELDRRCLFSCCDWSPDGTGILCPHDRDKIALWNPESGVPLWEIPLGQRPDDCEFSKDGSRIGLVAGTMVLRYANPSPRNRTPKLLFQKSLNCSFRSCSFFDDGRTFVYVSAVGQAGLVNVRDWSERTIEKNWGYDCSVSPDGKMVLVVGGSYGFAWAGIYEARSAERLGDLKGHQDIVNSCDWSPDGRWVATGSRDGTVKIWDPSVHCVDDEERSHSFGAAALSWQPDGSRVLSVGRDGRSHVWDPETGSWLATVESRDNATSPRPADCDYSPDGAAFVIGDEKGVLEVINADTRYTVWSVQAHEKEVRCCVWSSAGDRIASCGTEGVKTWNAQTAELLTVFENTEGASTICFSPDGRLLAVHSPSSIRFIDVEASQSIGRTGVVFDSGHEMVWSPDGLSLVIGDHDQSVVVLDPSTRIPLRRLSGHRGIELASSEYSGRYGARAEVLCGFVEDHRVAVTLCGRHLEGLGYSVRKARDTICC